MPVTETKMKHPYISTDPKVSARGLGGDQRGEHQE
jgi:hypothetical protein